MSVCLVSQATLDKLGVLGSVLLLWILNFSDWLQMLL